MSELSEPLMSEKVEKVEKDKSASLAFTEPEIDGDFDPSDKSGLTSEQVETLYSKYGYNELPVIEIPLWFVFIQQFTGTMPYMLELAVIISAAVQDWTDFGIILGMVRKFHSLYLYCIIKFPFSYICIHTLYTFFMQLICNGCIGFYEELKAAAALVSFIILIMIYRNIIWL